jgi:tetratricopeptide (TPR) repeat protein
VLIDLGRVDEALGELRTARQNAPENRQIVRLLARASERAERWEAALGHWQSVLSADPGNREAADHVKLCRALLDRDAIIGDQERKFADGTRSRRGLFGRIRGAG